MSIINAVDHTVRTVGGQASTAEAISPHDNYVYLVHNQGRNCWESVISDDGTTATVVPVHSYASALTLSLTAAGCTSPHPNPGPPTNMATGRFR